MMVLLLSLLDFHMLSAPPDTDNELQQLRRQIFRQQLELINHRYGHG